MQIRDVVRVIMALVAEHILPGGWKSVDLRGVDGVRKPVRAVGRFSGSGVLHSERDCGSGNGSRG
jgi:hypothetical protein